MTSHCAHLLLFSLLLVPVAPELFAASDWSNAGCIPGCSLCHANFTSCAVCAPRYGLDSSAPGTCKPCRDPYCTECSADYTRCTSCSASLAAATSSDQAQLGVGVDGTCVPCTVRSGAQARVSCRVCSRTFCILHAGDCEHQKHPLTQAYNCQSCARNASVCESCPVWQGINPFFGTCEPCQHQACTECMADSSKCTRCKADGWSVDPTNSTCIPCTLPHCDMCNTDGTCNKCLTGYGLDPSRACTQCSDPLCFRCHGNASACETCFAFASLNPTNNTCVRCSIPNCSTCSAGGGCTKCLAGYGGDGNGGCAPCAAGCAVCGADADVCEACMPFHASGGNTTTDGVECASCAYKAVCTDTTRMGPYSTGGVWETSPSRCSSLSDPQPEQVLANGTVCGLCSASIPTPMPISTSFFNITTWVRTNLLADQAGSLASALCSNGPLTSFEQVQPHSWCAFIASKPPTSTARHDVRFRATIRCGTVETVAGVRALVNVSTVFGAAPNVTVWNVQQVVLG